MRPKIRCDGESTVLLQNFLDLNWALVRYQQFQHQESNCVFSCRGVGVESRAALRCQTINNTPLNITYLISYPFLYTRHLLLLTVMSSRTRAVDPC
jgi:hypothetical protein